MESELQTELDSLLILLNHDIDDSDSILDEVVWYIRYYLEKEPYSDFKNYVRYVSKAFLVLERDESEFLVMPKEFLGYDYDEPIEENVLLKMLSSLIEDLNNYKKGDKS